MRRILDLFCGGGGGGMGYHRAGFEVIGVDIKPQPHYPFAFVCMDALHVLAILINGGYITDSNGRIWYLSDFDFIHTSPPCQFYSRTKNLKNAKNNHPDMVDATRAALQATGKPYIIENVPEAPLRNPLMLCGTMFGLGVLRHRLFETSPELYFPPATCQHGPVEPIWWEKQLSARRNGKKYQYITVAGNSFQLPAARRAMGIDWMTRAEIAQAIPPAYTEWIGKQLLNILEKLPEALC